MIVDLAGIERSIDRLSKRAISTARRRAALTACAVVRVSTISPGI
jgi:hypothetical protein